MAPDVEQILHVLSASMDHAQCILTAALAAGFRESGAVSLGSTKTGESTPIVAVRSAGYSFDSIIGYQDGEGRNIALVDERYLRTLVDVTNERFKVNTDRLTRFRNALLESYQSKPSTGASSNPDWEDADARKRRKRKEGLARQKALQDQPPQDVVDTEAADGDSINDEATSMTILKISGHFEQQTIHHSRPLSDVRVTDATTHQQHHDSYLWAIPETR
jgi:tRNA wybutosine-synthesizing protein 3